MEQSLDTVAFLVVLLGLAGVTVTFPPIGVITLPVGLLAALWLFYRGGGPGGPWK